MSADDIRELDAAREGRKSTADHFSGNVVRIGKEFWR